MRLGRPLGGDSDLHTVTPTYNPHPTRARPSLLCSQAAPHGHVGRLAELDFLCTCNW